MCPAGPGGVVALSRQLQARHTVGAGDGGAGQVARMCHATHRCGSARAPAFLVQWHVRVSLRATLG